MISDDQLAAAMTAALGILPEGTKVILISLDPKAPNVDVASHISNIDEERALYVLATILMHALKSRGLPFPPPPPNN